MESESSRDSGWILYCYFKSNEYLFAGYADMKSFACLTLPNGAALWQGLLGYSQDEFFKKYQESVDRKWQDTADDSVICQKVDRAYG